MNTVSDKKAIHISQPLAFRLAIIAAQTGTDVEALAEKWLAERESDELRRQARAQAGKRRNRTRRSGI